MEDRKLNNQTSDTKKLRAGKHAPIKRIKPTVRSDNLISERLVTEKVDKNQESSLLVRLTQLTESSDYLVSGTSAYTKGR